jgi:probable HAF family extracellular repeat protein
MKKTTMVSAVLSACLAVALAPLASAQHQHAFVWDSTTGMTDLGTLGGNTSYALGINDSGVVAGYSYLSDNITTHAFLWTAAGGMVDISTGLQPGTSSQADFVNVRGDVAGTSLVGTRPQVPAARVGHRWMLLPSLRADNRNYGFGINKLDQVTGQQYGDPDGYVHAFFWDLRTNTKLILQTHPDGVDTVGNAINDRSHVTGTGDILSSGAYQAFLWLSTTGAPTVIGQLAGSTYTAGEGINNQDEVVGINAALAGFYWNSTTGIVPLQSLGGTVSAAFGINNTGMISGFGGTATGIVHAVRWSHYTDAPLDLGTLLPGGNSYARGINNLGQVVGYADVP